MVHGRFQPFHRGHLEYFLRAAGHCDHMIVGITNPDVRHLVFSREDPTRHLPEANPFTFFERMTMVKLAAEGAGYPLDRLDIVPFPVERPDLWQFYVPSGTRQYIRVFSPWGQHKTDLFRAHGHDVVVLDPQSVKDVEGSDVRLAMRADQPWRDLVPEAVANYITTLPTYSAMTRDRESCRSPAGR